ncbi:MAG: thioredoxin domain-containing protein [Candidatus Jorgensenbacteria bacterium]|nr:thioredoxin domain-containing protein [Candidatus Jorgensenbacteria bacterium]
MNEIQGGETKKGDYFLPVSIVVAAILISGAVFYSAGSISGPNDKLAANLGTVVQKKTLPNVPPIGPLDHREGSENAPVTLVTYTDFECPFCKQFHETARQALDAYAPNVALIYRNYPISDLHSKASKEAEAAECAAELGSNAAYWKFVDRLFSVTPSNNGLNPIELPKIAQYAGLDVAAFNDCLSSGKEAVKIATQVKDAEDAGISGTPFSIVFVRGKAVEVIPGALSFDDARPEVSTVKQIIEAAMK